MKRIVSLLPSATDVVGVLGVEDWLVGVSHECDWPASVRRLPRLTRGLISPDLPPAQIDAAVNQSVHTHRSLYDLDGALLHRLKPDVILTQELCDVCAVSYDQVLGAARLLHGDGDSPAILSLEPTSLAEVIDTVQVVANELGCADRGQAVSDTLRERLQRAYHLGKSRSHHPSVLVLEWTDPPFTGGHWVPEMIEAAGGINAPLQAARRGIPSVRVGWEEIQANDPDVIVVGPCGYNREGASKLIAALADRPEWQALRAVRKGRVFPVDANSFFSRPGPRLFDGIDQLRAILDQVETSA